MTHSPELEQAVAERLQKVWARNAALRFLHADEPWFKVAREALAIRDETVARCAEIARLIAECAKPVATGPVPDVITGHILGCLSVAEHIGAYGRGVRLHEACSGCDAIWSQFPLGPASGPDSAIQTPDPVSGRSPVAEIPGTNIGHPAQAAEPAERTFRGEWKEVVIEMDEIARITLQPVRAYLDRCIDHWRKQRDEPISTPPTMDEAQLLNMAILYIDAFQSVRSSIFGETKP